MAKFFGRALRELPRFEVRQIRLSNFHAHQFRSWNGEGNGSGHVRDSAGKASRLQENFPMQNRGTPMNAAARIWKLRLS